MRVVYSVLFVMIMAVMAGCGKDAYSSRAQGVNFGEFKTYAWLPMQKDTTNGNVLDNEITYLNLREAANREMKKRGYTLDTQNPDVLLMLHADFEEEREVVRNYANSGFYPGYYANPWSPYYGGFYGGFYSYPYVMDYSVYDYVKGTVVIDVINREENQLVWRGWSEKRITDYDDINKLYEEVEDIFKEFPVDSKGRVKK